jgi:hypothetical protein
VTEPLHPINYIVYFFFGDTTTHVLPHHPLDWKAYIHEDMATSTRINGFLWHRVSQGYSRVVVDQPPFESWRAWRAGYRDHRPAPYLTPAASSVRELPSELDGASAAAVAVAVAELAAKGSSSNSGAGGYDTGVRTVTVTAPPMLAGAPAAAAAAASASSSGSTVTPYSEGAATGSRRGVGGVVVAGVTGNDGDWDQEGEEELEYEDVKVLTTTPTGPVWAFPSWSSGQSQASSSSSSSGGIGRSMSTNTSGQGRSFCQRQISFKLNAPEDMEFAVIQCTLTKRREGVKNGKHVPPRSVTYGCLTLDFLLETQLKVDYAEDLS